MARNYEIYKELEQFAGKTVLIDGLQYRLCISVYEAVYPVRERVISAYLNPVSKTSKHYLESKKLLKDDWSLDMFELGLEEYCNVYNQLTR
jgi:hypothetical protein